MYLHVFVVHFLGSLVRRLFCMRLDYSVVYFVACTTVYCSTTFSNQDPEIPRSPTNFKTRPQPPPIQSVLSGPLHSAINAPCHSHLQARPSSLQILTQHPIPTPLPPSSLPIALPIPRSPSDTIPHSKQHTPIPTPTPHPPRHPHTHTLTQPSAPVNPAACKPCTRDTTEGEVA